MPRWTPTPIWTGDAFIIGGGPSLRGFDFERLAGQATVGCNSAFRLGGRIFAYCLFSDENWYRAFEKELEAFDGPVVSQCEYIPDTHPWVRKMARQDEGLSTEALGFGGNTGCSAINLALILGARRVYLLGFDCKPELRHNWHDFQIEQTPPECFGKFLEGFRSVARALPRVFPGREVYNCTPLSAIDCFPFIDINAVLRQEAA